MPGNDSEDQAIENGYDDKDEENDQDDGVAWDDYTQDH